MKTEQELEHFGLNQLDNKIVISFERQKIEIPLNFEVPKDKIIYKMFCDLRDKVNSLEIELKKEILEYLKQLKQEGFKKINIIDLVGGLNLPAEQIEKVMDTLEGVNI